MTIRSSAAEKPVIQKERIAVTALIRHLVLLAVTFCAAAAMWWFPGSAAAAPSLAVDLTRLTSDIHRGDELVRYEVEVTNGSAGIASCAPGIWSGAPDPNFSYQWLRDGASLGAANGAQTAVYTPQAADVGHVLQCQVTAVNPGASAVQASAPLFYGEAPPTPAPAPANAMVPAARPAIEPEAGSAVANNELTCKAPTNWVGNPGWSFQWLANGAAGAGSVVETTATTSKYKVDAADEGKVIQCRATGVNTSGASIAYSNNKNAGTPVFPPANVPAGSPSIDGAEWVEDGVVLSASLPAGMKFGFAEGAGWTCVIGSCATTKAIAPQGVATAIVGLWIDPDETADTLSPAFTVAGGEAGNAAAQDTFTQAPAKPFAILNLSAKAETESGSDFTQAGGHPHSATSFLELPTHTTPVFPVGLSNLEPVEDMRSLSFDLPVGFIGNPQTSDRICTVAQVRANACPASAAVGGIDIDVVPDDVTNEAPIFRIYPEEGYPAAFAVKPVTFAELVYVLRAQVRSNGDYGVTAVSPLPPQSPSIMRIDFAKLCTYGAKVGFFGGFEGCLKEGQPESHAVPFLSNPTECAGEAPKTTVFADSYQNPGRFNEEDFPDLTDPNWKTATVSSPAPTGCEALTEAWVGKGPDPTSPTFSFQPDTRAAASPAGYSVRLHIPQDGLMTQTGLATSHLKDTIVDLPEGVALNPSAADGLGACSLEQAGYEGNDFPAPNPIHFNTTSEGCPDNSKVATVEVTTPLLEKPLPGAMYLAAQDRNPFGSRFATYLVIDDAETGTKATLAGRVTPDKRTGQIRAVFENNPQVPIEDLEVEFFGGPRASLANPDVCGTYTVSTQMTPWSAKDPDNPLDSEIAVSNDPIAIDAGPEGRRCATSKADRPFDLGFSAGGDNVFAGKSTQFKLRLTRPDGSQELDQISVTTPPGFAATLKGVEICSWAAVDSAAAREKGAAEIASPSCPSASQIGTTTIGAGVGSNPYYVKTGKIYLTGPYKGAPLSLSFIVPAVAGPFDLGVQVVKTALNVNPKTAQVTAVSDPVPQILEGVPLQLRDIRVELDPDFGLNPTSCNAMSIDAKVTGANGAVANLGNRFQVGGCKDLPFKPKLKLRLKGSPKRASYQRLTATVTARRGDANIARTAVTMPHSIFLAQEHIRTVCTRVQFAADNCPKASIYGFAEATTPLLDGKIQGPVYLRSSDNTLPDLVAALRGPDAQPIEVELSGRTDSKNQGIRNTFDIVPDAPVTKFTLRMYGGQKSLLVSSQHLCKGGPQKATVRMAAHNGKRHNFRPALKIDCGKKKKGKGGKSRGR